MSDFRLVAYPDRASWLEARRFSIGSSDAAGLMGESRWSSPVQLNYQKRALIPVQEPDPERIEALDWHRERESEIARWWWSRQLRGHRSTTGEDTDDWASFVSRPTTDEPLAMQEEGGVYIYDPGDYTVAVREIGGVPLSATLDRALLSASRWLQGGDCSAADGFADGPLSVAATVLVAPVELKNAAEWMRAHWTVNEPPLVYQLQVQHQMLVTGARYAYLVASIGGQPPVWAELKADLQAQAILLRTYKRFWESVVGNYDLPADYSEVTSNAIAERYPKDDGSTVVLGPEGDTWWRSRTDALEAIKALEKTKAEANNNLKQAFGEATYARLPSGLTLKLAADCNGNRTTIREHKEREAA